ncbi:MAG: ATP synthase F0 subunit C [Candidatus Kapabacteria bacterium]|nr:ATP synthase F0 subunit C [Candidatus Kapabacteria bacterium]MBX7154479.1 ATP synthase F0 subunit C [Bacteroidota bacterium]
MDPQNAIAVAKATATGFAWLAAGLGCGVTVIGVGTGIGRLAASALEAGARQPEAAGEVRTTMIIGAALIEGVALFAMVVCVLLAIK